MNAAHMIRWGDAKAMPWKNGGGVTHEIAVNPEGAGLGDFIWRISMAEVASDGPFSCFDGIDRTLCLLDGAGIALEFDDGATATIDATALPFAFAGDRAVTGRLIGGPILDLNVMTRRGAATHRVTRRKVTGRAAFGVFGMTALVCTGGAQQVHGYQTGLRPKDCLILGAGVSTVTLDGEGSILVIEIEAD